MAGFVPGDVLTNGFGGFVAWVLFHLSTRRGTFSLHFVAAHVLQHGAGNSYGRFRALIRTGSGGAPLHDRGCV